MLPGPQFRAVKVITDNGLYGLRDATVYGREMAVATYLEEHVAPCLIGRDPSRHRRVDSPSKQEQAVVAEVFQRVDRAGIAHAPMRLISSTLGVVRGLRRE